MTNEDQCYIKNPLRHLLVCSFNDRWSSMNARHATHSFLRFRATTKKVICYFVSVIFLIFLYFCAAVNYTSNNFRFELCKRWAALTTVAFVRGEKWKWNGFKCTPALMAPAVVFLLFFFCFLYQKDTHLMMGDLFRFGEGEFTPISCAVRGQPHRSHRRCDIIDSRHQLRCLNTYTTRPHGHSTTRPLGSAIKQLNKQIYKN